MYNVRMLCFNVVITILDEAFPKEEKSEMSRNCELFAGGNNCFKIKDIEGYKKWKATLGENLQGILHEEKDEFGFHVYIGLRWEKKTPLDELDTYMNHFHPNGEGWDEGHPIAFWGGLSLFTEEPIDLFQTDEEFPYLTKVFGWHHDEGMYRVYAKEGKVVVQELGFVVVKEETQDKDEYLEEEDLEWINNRNDIFCEKCKDKIDESFRFDKRKYYEEIKDQHKFNKLCKKCYVKLKKDFTKINKIRGEISQKEKELEELTQKGEGANR